MMQQGQDVSDESTHMVTVNWMQRRHAGFQGYTFNVIGGEEKKQTQVLNLIQCEPSDRH